MREKKELVLILWYALLIGLITGAITAMFGHILLWITGLRDARPMYFLPFLPLVGAFMVWMYEKYGARSKEGMGLVFGVGHGDEEKIPKRLVPFVMISTWLTHLFGGSAGREGVAVQIGAAVANNMEQKSKIKNASRIFLITGMAAGFAGLFQTPFAAVFFAMEVLVVGRLELDAWIPAAVAAFASFGVSSFLQLEKFTVVLPELPEFTWILFGKLLCLGVIFGVVGTAFAWLLGWSKRQCQKFVPHPVKRIFMLGIILMLLLIFFEKGRYAGLGTNLISASFSNGEIYSWDWLLKLILTIFTLSIGFQGGEVTPLFSIGASLGIGLAALLDLPLAFCAALGYAAVFGSATNTIFAPILIGAEVFGIETLPYFMVVCLIGHIFSPLPSIYGKQKRLTWEEQWKRLVIRSAKEGKE